MAAGAAVVTSRRRRGVVPPLRPRGCSRVCRESLRPAYTGRETRAVPRDGLSHGRAEDGFHFASGGPRHE